jgi:hypothetical protein
LLVALAVLLAGLVQTPAAADGEAPPAASREAAARIPLTGETALVVSEPTSFQVVLRRSVSLNFRPNQLFKPGAVFEAEGGGRVTGFVLTRDWPGAEVALAAMKVRECDQPGCSDGAVMRSSVPFGRKVSVDLPAGTYRLYAIVDDSPVRITLRFPGLKGRSVHRVGESAEVDLSTPTGALSEAGPATVYDAGDSYAFKRQYGLAFSATWVRGDEYKGSTVAWCFSPSQPLAADASNHACADPLGARGLSGDEFTLQDPRADRFVLFTVITLGPQQLDPAQGGFSDWSYGLSAFSPGPSTSVGSQAFTLTF